jgi:hypothetical protein
MPMMDAADMTDKPIKRKIGRPRKSGQGRPTVHVRFTPECFAQLKAAATLAGRSISEEVEFRIEKLDEMALQAAERFYAELRHLTKKEIRQMIEDAIARRFKAP